MTEHARSRHFIVNKPDTNVAVTAQVIWLIWRDYARLVVVEQRLDVDESES